MLARQAEAQGDVLPLGRSTEEREIEPAAGYGIDRVVGVLRVRLEGEFAEHGVHHPAAHRDGIFENFFVEPCALQCCEPARGERKVDRSPADEAALARVGTAFDKRDAVAEVREEDRDKRASEAGTDNQNVCVRGLHGDRIRQRGFV